MNTFICHTVEEASKLLGIGRTKLYQELNSGRLRAIKVGKKTLIPHDNLLEWVAICSPYQTPKSNPYA